MRAYQVIEQHYFDAEEVAVEPHSPGVLAANDIQKNGQNMAERKHGLTRP
jgi:hypothetical protein